MAFRVPPLPPLFRLKLWEGPSSRSGWGAIESDNRSISPCIHTTLFRSAPAPRLSLASITPQACVINKRKEHHDLFFLFFPFPSEHSLLSPTIQTTPRWSVVHDNQRRAENNKNERQTRGRKVGEGIFTPIFTNIRQRKEAYMTARSNPILNTIADACVQRSPTTQPRERKKNAFS